MSKCRAGCWRCCVSTGEFGRSGDGGRCKFPLGAHPVLFGRTTLATAAFPIGIRQAGDGFPRRRGRLWLSYRCGESGGGSRSGCWHGPFCARGSGRFMTGRNSSGYGYFFLRNSLTRHIELDLPRTRWFFLIVTDRLWPVHQNFLSFALQAKPNVVFRTMASE
jgi:hypothetical protein